MLGIQYTVFVYMMFCLTDSDDKALWHVYLRIGEWKKKLHKESIGTILM